MASARDVPALGTHLVMSLRTSNFSTCLMMMQCWPSPLYVWHGHTQRDLNCPFYCVEIVLLSSRLSLYALAAAVLPPASVSRLPSPVLPPCRLVEFALSRHLPEGSTAVGNSGALDMALQHHKGGPDDASVGLTSARLADSALERLSKAMRSLNSLALKVNSIQPLSAISRGTVAFPPLPHPLAGGPGGGMGGMPLPRCMDAIEVLVQLEGSGTHTQRHTHTHPNIYILPCSDCLLAS